MFPYNKIFKRAWELTKTNRFLWLFGLFLVWAHALVLNENQQPQNLPQGAVLIAAIIALAVFLVILYFRMQAGLIVAIKAILDKQPASFGRAFKAGKFFFGRILGISLLLELSSLLLALIILGPISGSSGIRGIILWIFGLTILIPVMAVITLGGILAPMFIVIYDLKIREAAERSYELIREFWPKLLFFFICILFLQMFPLFLSIFMLGLVGGLWFKIVVASALVAVSAPIAVFQQTAWILMFLEIVRPQKMDQQEVVPAPEIVG